MRRLCNLTLDRHTTVPGVVCVMVHSPTDLSTCDGLTTPHATTMAVIYIPLCDLFSLCRKFIVNTVPCGGFQPQPKCPFFLDSDCPVQSIYVDSFTSSAHILTLFCRMNQSHTHRTVSHHVHKLSARQHLMHRGIFN